MKDLLTYYHKSPPKPIAQIANSNNNTKASMNSQGKTSDSNQNAEDNDARNKLESSNKECNIKEIERSHSPEILLVTEDASKTDATSKEDKENTTTSQQKHRRKRSKKPRKQSDPAVRSIADLFNSSLNIVSPNTSKDASKNTSPLPGADEASKIHVRRSSSDFETPKSLKKSSNSNGSKPNTSEKKDKPDDKKLSSSTPPDLQKKVENIEAPLEPKQSKRREKLDKCGTSNATKNVSSKKEVNADVASPESHSADTNREKHKKIKSEKKKSESVAKSASSKSSKKSDSNAHLTDDENIEENSTKNEVIISQNETTSSPETPKVKINAFQFMMESRHKSIGQNLEGKDLQPETASQEDKEKKDKRLLQKRNLEKLAQSKIDIKRKRREEDKDVYINHQLEKRAKRLKKLLNAKTEDDAKEETETQTPRRSSRRRVIKPTIQTDSEDDNDSEIEIVQIIPETKSTNTISNKNHDENGKNDKNTESKSPKSTTSKQNGLLSFLGITNKLKIDDANVQNNSHNGGVNSEKVLELINVEKSTSKTSKENRRSKLGLKQIDIAEEKCSAKEESEKRRSKTNKKAHHSKLEVTKIDIVIEENANLSVPCNRENLEECTIIANEVLSTFDSSVDNTASTGPLIYCETSCSQDNTADKTEGHRTPKTNKHKRRKKHIEDHLLGRSPSQWKMKIKLTSDDEGLSVSDILRGKNPGQSTSENHESNSHVSHESKHVEGVKVSKNGDLHVKEIILSSDSDEEVQPSNPRHQSSLKKNMKIAPIFLKATPKPKVDPKLAEAKRQFLMSGVPDNLKKRIEKQESMEEVEFDIFPSISHVLQKCPSNKFWDMPSVDLHLNCLLPLQNDECKPIYKELTHKHITTENIIVETTEKINISKQLIDQIKSENSTYPVYKVFRSLYEKSGLRVKSEEKKIIDNSEKKSKKRKGKRKKSKGLSDSTEIIEDPPEKNEMNSTDYAMWTEKYKPLASSDIIGNASTVSQLKKWLEKWVEPIEDSSSKKKRKRSGSSSDSDFEFTDGDSRDSSCSPKNTIILKGPNGSGKTAAVYAVCNELGMNVLELNPSSKRSGKWLLQELQEATQSHQVMKGESASLSQFLKTEKSKENSQSDSQQSSQNKICVILIEDVDIIFDQDEGFLSALSQLIITSKRPIILTTTDDTSQNISKFVSHHPIMSFNALTAYALATWLQMLCLIEGVAIDNQSVGLLLEKNNGDIRKTLLQLQFWVLTGGDLRKTKTNSILTVPKINQRRPSSYDKLTEDESSNLSFIHVETAQNSIEYQTSCLNSFEIISRTKRLSIPYGLNLSKIWWNLPNILSLNKSEYPEKNIGDLVESRDSRDEKAEDKKKLLAICTVYDNLLLADMMTKKKDCMVDLEPCPRQWDCMLKDSLELGETCTDYSGATELTEDISHTLIDGSICLYRNITNTESWINLGLPSTNDKRWRAKQHLCEDILQDALSVSSYVDRRPVSVDIMPTLRHIGRSEMVRASNNRKRGNRFNNYLRGLGIDGGDSSYKVICNVLNVERFK